MENKPLQFALLSFMADKKISSAVFAKHGKISPNTLYNFFNGHSETLTHQILAKLAKGNGVTVAALLAWKPSTMGARIGVYRQLLGWSQIEVAEKINVAQPSVCRWEKHEAEPDEETIQKLGDLFGVHAKELRYGELGEFIERPGMKELATTGRILTPTPLVRWQLLQLHKGPNGQETWKDVPGVTMSAEGK